MRKVRWGRNRKSRRVEKVVMDVPRSDIKGDGTRTLAMEVSLNDKVHSEM